MFKMICKCGESLWNGEIPTNNELVVYTDKEWNNIIEKGTLNSWEIPEPQFDVWRCSKCERIYVFEEGIEEVYKVYKLEEISIDENIEGINRENEEIDKIINKMSKKQNAQNVENL